MGNKRHIAFVSLLVAMLFGFAWVVLLQSRSEPVYEGKPLSDWLESIKKNDGFDPDAESAVRAIGTNALPALLNMVRVGNSAIRQGLTELSLNQKWIPISTRSQWQFQEAAEIGFGLLGSSAKAAVPALVDCLQEDDSRIRACAAYCLGKIGPASHSAVPVLVKSLGSALGRKGREQDAVEMFCEATALGEIGPAARAAILQLNLFSTLTNHSFYPWVRAQAALIKIRGDSLLPLSEALKDTSNQTNWLQSASVVSYLGSYVEPTIPSLLAALRRTNADNQKFVIRLLGQIHSRPEVCIPAIIPFLQSTDYGTCTDSIEAIRAFGGTPNQLGLDEITRLLSNSIPTVREEAAKALRKMTPEVAAKAMAK